MMYVRSVFVVTLYQTQPFLNVVQGYWRVSTNSLTNQPSGAMGMN